MRAIAGMARSYKGDPQLARMKKPGSRRTDNLE
jgi:hypothetical protein